MLIRIELQIRMCKFTLCSFYFYAIEKLDVDVCLSYLKELQQDQLLYIAELKAENIRAPHVNVHGLIQIIFSIKGPKIGTCFSFVIFSSFFPSSYFCTAPFVCAMYWKIIMPRRCTVKIEFSSLLLLIMKQYT